MSLSLLEGAFLFANPLKSQNIENLINLIDTTKGINLGLARTEEIYHNLKNNPDSVIKLYNLLEKYIKLNEDVNDLKFHKTEYENFYEIWGYGVDFDPEFLTETEKDYALIYSTTSCAPCKLLIESIKEYLRENNVKNFKVYDIIIDKDINGNIIDLKKALRTRANLASTILRKKKNTWPYTYFFEEGKIKKVTIGSGEEPLNVIKEITKKEKIN